MKQIIQQKQIQKLILTQDLKQTLEILQYSYIELEEMLEQESEENPFLKKRNNHVPFWDVYQPLDYTASEKKQKAIENLPQKNQSLYSHLWEQIVEYHFTEKQKEAAKIIISSLDKNGFLTTDIQDLLSSFKMSEEEMIYIKKTIAQLDPPGCGAKDYVESMILQLEQKNLPEAKDATLLLSSYKQELEEGNFDIIKQKTGLDDQKIQKALSLMRTLNPFPGKNYSVEEIVYIQPDLYIFFEDEKNYKIVLNERDLHNYDVDKENFHKILNDKNLSKDKINELKKKYRTAQNLIRSIHLRNSTLLSLGEALIKFQLSFFYFGKNHLNPLRIKDVADELKLHSSTISRIARNKYVYTKWGTFPLKFFFKRGIKKLSKDEMISTDKVKQTIREIIQKEDKEIPLRDKEIAEILIKKFNIKIARRTIAKYRKEMNIPSAHERVKKS